MSRRFGWATESLMRRAPRGLYAQVRAIRADRLVPLPDDIDDESAAAMMLKGMTVEYLIRRTYPVQAGANGVVPCSGGRRGADCVSMACALGGAGDWYGRYGGRSRMARDNGCHHAIVYTKEDFVKRVREITNGAGVPVVYDSVGRATFAGSLDCLSPRGMLVGFGNASGKPEPFDMTVLAQKGSLYLTRPALFAYTSTRQDLLASALALFEVVRTQMVKVDIRQRWPLAEVVAAHRSLEARMTTRIHDPAAVVSVLHACCLQFLGARGMLAVERHVRRRTDAPRRPLGQPTRHRHPRRLGGVDLRVRSDQVVPSRAVAVRVDRTRSAWFCSTGLPGRYTWR